MSTRLLKLFLLIMFSSLVTACASNTFIQEIQPVKTSLSPYNKAIITVKEGSPSVKTKKGFEASKSALEKDFAASLTELNTFHIISRTQAKGVVENDTTLLINLIIEDFQYLSGASSVVAGVFSGNAYFKVRAQIIDLKSGDIIGEVRSGAHTESSDGIFRGSTGTLITKISKKLAKEIDSYK
ncbi:hypothetical protein [Endozoicomonas sp. Mp262]|uniref:hypothetical protein n=1 Tax=Endozoicomonas sp. Mp262 TaxID=2919499 RepID=UPI0021D8434B